MPSFPAPLIQLLRAPSDARDRRWTAFLDRYSDLILFAIRKTESDRDAVSDAYTFVLDKLREDDYRRLRSFQPAGSGAFATWLVVVVRRLTIDHHRARHGRRRGPGAEDRPDPRAALDRLASAVEDVTTLPDAGATDPEMATQRAEVVEALEACVRELPTSDRLLLTLRFHDDLSASEVAEALGLPTAFHVYRRLRKTLERLRHALLARGIDGPG